MSEAEANPAGDRITLRRSSTLAAVVAALLAVGVWAAPGSRAQEAEGAAVVTDVGWWSATPGQPEPEGGFQVSQSPQGEPTAVAGLKIKVNVKTLASALLVFGEGSTKLSEASADIRLCRAASSDWSADDANPGALGDAPDYDCGRSVQLKRSATLQSWSGDAAALLSGPGTVTLMVVPGEPNNGSIPQPSYENLPRLQTPVPTPIGIPPPLPVDIRSPDPLGPVFATANCPPGFYDVTEGLGRPQQCLGLPRVVPPTPIPGLPLPPTIDLPFPIGFQVQMASTQMSAFAPDETSFSDVEDLSSGGVSDSGIFNTGGSSVLGASGSLPLTEAGAAALGAGTDSGLPGVAQLASSGGGRPWGRIWLLGLAAALVGAGSVWARRQAQALAQ